MFSARCFSPSNTGVAKRHNSSFLKLSHSACDRSQPDSLTIPNSIPDDSGRYICRADVTVPGTTIPPVDITITVTGKYQPGRMIHWDVI